METKPEPHRQNHVRHEEAQEGEQAAVMEHGALSLQRGVTNLFGRRHDEEQAVGRRGEIREVDFFSRVSRPRDQDSGGGGGRGVPGGGRDDVNVSLRDIDRQLLARLLRIGEIRRRYCMIPF